MFENNNSLKSFLLNRNKPKAPFEEVKAWCSYAAKLLWSLKGIPESKQHRVYRDLKMNMPESFNFDQKRECHRFIADVYNKIPCCPENEKIDC